MRTAWFIARKDLSYLLRRRETLLWVFFMPILFIYFIGTVTGGAGFVNPQRRDAIVVRGATGAGVIADQIVHRLEGQRFDVTRSGPNEDVARFARQLTLPVPGDAARTFSDAVLAGERQVLSFDRKGDDLGARFDRVRVSRAMYEVLGDLAVLRVQHVEPSPEHFAEIERLPRALTLKVQSAGRRIEPPSGFSQAVPGEMVMLTLLVLLTSGAIMLVIERDQGLLRRLASAPISTGSVVFGKWIGRVLLGLVQIAFAMLAGIVLFSMDWGRVWPMVCVVLIAWASFTASLALVLGSVVSSPAQMAGLGVMTTMVLAALGGCWWPIEVAPAWMQRIAIFLPTGWTMDALHKLVNFGDPATAAIPHVLGLTVASLLLGAVGVRVFKYQ